MPNRFLMLLALALLTSAGCSGPSTSIPVVMLDAGGGEVSSDVGATVDLGLEDARDTDDATVDTDDLGVRQDLRDEVDLGDVRVPIGTVWNTYYWLADEAEHPGPKTVELLDAACEPVGTVSEDYADALCIEGSGKLDDGTVVNYHSLCDCGRPCSSGSIICWSALDGAQFPWGQGAYGNALEPLRSISVDRDFIALRTPVYIEEFDGLEIPSLGGVQGFTHNGCFLAADVGGAIDGNHIDIFAGTTPMWRHLETVFPTRGNLTAFTGVGKCADGGQ